MEKFIRPLQDFHLALFLSSTTVTWGRDSFTAVSALLGSSYTKRYCLVRRDELLATSSGCPVHKQVCERQFRTKLESISSSNSLTPTFSRELCSCISKETALFESTSFLKTSTVHINFCTTPSQKWREQDLLS